MADESKSPDASKLEALQQQVAALQEPRRTTKSTDDVQRGAFDPTYAELRQYEDFIFQAEKPLLLDLLLFYDSLIWFRTSLESGEVESKVVGESFQFLIDEFEESHSTDATSCRPSPKTSSIGSGRKPCRWCTPTTFHRLAYQPGHQARIHPHERVLRPEEVILHRYRAPQDHQH